MLKNRGQSPLAGSGLQSFSFIVTCQFHKKIWISIFLFKKILVFVQSLSDVWLLETPWTAAWGFPVLHYLPEFAQVHVIKLVMPSNCLILCHSLLLLPLIFPSIRVFSNEYLEYMYLQYNLYLDYIVSAIQFQNIAKAILWPPDVKSWLIGKDSDAGKDWRQEEKWMTEDEMIGWHQWTWAWANSRREWRTGKPGMLQPMGSQRVRLDWATEQQQFFSAQTSSWPTLRPVHDHWKNHSFDYKDFGQQSDVSAF